MKHQRRAGLCQAAGRDPAPWSRRGKGRGQGSLDLTAASKDAANLTTIPSPREPLAGTHSALAVKTWLGLGEAQQGEVFKDTYSSALLAEQGRPLGQVPLWGEGSTVCATTAVTGTLACQAGCPGATSRPRKQLRFVIEISSHLKQTPVHARGTVSRTAAN